MRTVLVYGLTNHIGGIENYLMLMQKYLHNELSFVFLVEETEKLIYEDDINSNNGKIEYLPDRHKITEYNNRFHDILKRYKDNTNILYVNVSHISFDIIPIKIGQSEGYRVVTHSHGAGQEPIKNLKYRMLHAVLRLAGNVRLKHTDVERLAVSKRAGDFLYHGKPYKIVAPGIEVKKYVYNLEKRNEIRDRFGITNNVVLGFVGRIVAVKNPLFLIDILQMVKKKRINAKLLVVGDGNLKKEMLDKATAEGLEEDIVFAGEVTNVQDYYQAMDVLLAPSFSEGMPLGIMEAQSAGVPCICAKDNFPESIDVTRIVRFCSLSLGADYWAEEVAHIIEKRIDRLYYNEIVKKSPLNIERAAQNLLDIFKQYMTGSFE